MGAGGISSLRLEAGGNSRAGATHLVGSVGNFVRSRRFSSIAFSRASSCRLTDTGVNSPGSVASPPSIMLSTCFCTELSPPPLRAEHSQLQGYTGELAIGFNELTRSDHPRPLPQSNQRLHPVRNHSHRLPPLH